MKKALIILYYWPPSGGSAVQRWLNFTSYMPEFGWQPIIYAPENADYPERDDTLTGQVDEHVQVIKQPIREPYAWYRKFSGSKKSGSVMAGMTMTTRATKWGRYKNAVFIWLRGNFFIPDARKWWIRPSVRFLEKWLKSNPVDVIITTGPPHSLHLIGLHLKALTGLPWIADFRDPWTNIDFYQELRLTRIADRKHRILEKKVLMTADRVVAISPTMGKEFKDLGAESIEIITNGFDDRQVQGLNIFPDAGFSIFHLGTISKSRNSESFWMALRQLTEVNESFRNDLVIKLAGNIDYSVTESINGNSLRNFVTELGYLPHQDALVELMKSQVLLLLINNSPNARGVLTGKFFEYLRSKRPILLIGPEDGDAAEILVKTGAGLVADFNLVEPIKAAILEFYQQYKLGNLIVNPSGIMQYSRKELTRTYCRLLDSLD